MRLILAYLTLLAIALATRETSASPPARWPAAQLLPTDTLALVSIPDWDTAMAYWKRSAQGKLCQDPALKPVRDKLLEKWQEEVAEPLARRSGLKVSDYFDLLHGQVTLALTQNNWGIQPGASLGLLLLVDTKDREPALKARLAELRKQWSESGRAWRIEKIRDIDFTALIVSADDLDQTLEKLLPWPKESADLDDGSPAAERADKNEIYIGQSGPLLLVGNNPRNLERVLARQAGSVMPALADQAAYAANQGALFRDALAFGWMNFAPAFAIFQKHLADAAKGEKEDAPFSPRLDRILAAAGLGGISTVAARLSGTVEGTSAEVFLGIPESKRRGVFALAPTQRKDAGPPPFVSADVLRFRRWRMGGAKAWGTLETMLNSISPAAAGLIQMGLQAAGKDRDPDFDLRRALTSSLGDDFIYLEKSPRASGSTDLASAPSLYLIGSPNPDQFVQALKTGSGLLPLAGGDADVQQREFLGRKVYSVSLASGATLGKGSPPRLLSFATGNGYAAFSTDTPVLEEYLRTSDSTGKVLREVPGLAEVAEKVGGMDTGFFEYQNQAEAMRLWFEGNKTESTALDRLLSWIPQADEKRVWAAAKKPNTPWVDPALLPPFERISRFFSFAVYSISSSHEGLSWKMFLPAPPRLEPKP